MPLRVTKEYSTGDENGKKIHRKMSKNGHFQRVRRPTGLEVYNDAAKILEELLEKRIDRDVKVARQRRNRTDPTKQRESVSTGGENIPVTRCKTMPSRYRQSSEDEIKKESEEVDKREQRKRMKNGMIVGPQTDSSANDTPEDSDPEEENSTRNRKKKSIFKRAKENLIRTFQRDQKDKLDKRESEEKVSPVKKRKHKKKSASVISESKRSVKAHMNEDKSIDYTEIVDYRESQPSSKSESPSHKVRSGSISRNSLLDSIRKPFKRQKGKINLDDDEKRKLQAEENVESLTLQGDDFTPIQPQQAARSISPTPHPQPPSSISIQDGRRTGSSSISPSSPYHRSSPSSELPQSTGVRESTLSSNASTHYPASEFNNSVGSLDMISGDNILDKPGEDIGYIDDDSDKEKRKSLIKYHGSEGLLNLKWLAAQTANVKDFDFKIDEHCVSTRLPDGHLETVTTVTATRTVVLPEVVEEPEDAHDGKEDNPDMMRDEIYGKIAKKLIEMADTYSAGMSDTENPAQGAAALISDAPLTDLEKEIIACLRSGGDKYGKKMEDQLDAIKSAVTEDAYSRFRSTVDNSMGHELSWSTIALLFYATKGVVSAVGKSSQVAVQAKEFTLKYISDTFVSWIMEQGGFDSMLSGSESDPELD